MSSTPHPFTSEEIMAYVDRELPVDRDQSISTHVETCAACLELVGSLRNTSRSLSGWVVGPVPARLDNNVVNSALQPASPGVYRFFPLHGRTRKQWIGGLTVAAVGTVFLFSIFVSIRYRSESMADKTSVLAHLREQRAPVANAQTAEFGRVKSEQAQPVVAGHSYADSGFDWSTQAPSASPQAGYKSKGLLPSEAKNPASGLTLPAPMIARTVSLSLIAKDFESARASLDGILARHNGYAADLNVSTPEGAARSLQGSLRIPAPQLPAALAELKSLGRVELEAQNGEEVTQQHADLVARLKNSRETEQRLQAILTQRTGKISDVLEVEQEIARVRGEIEQMEAEQKNLEHRVDFATIDLKLSEEYKAKLDSATPSISTQIHNAAVNGYRNVADTLLSIVLFFAEYGPVLIFWLLVLALPATLVWRRWRHATAAI
jgi:anti-sigma factor RsiW